CHARSEWTLNRKTHHASVATAAASRRLAIEAPSLGDKSQSVDADVCSSPGSGQKGWRLTDVRFVPPTKNLVHKVGGSPEQVGEIGPIGHQTARFDRFPQAVHRRQSCG